MIIDNNFEFKTEKSEQLLVKTIVRSGMTVFDVGANIGNYTLLFSQLVDSQGKVFAFEPTSSTFTKLQERVNKSKYQNIYLFQNAVFSENKPIELHEFSEEYASWNSMGIPQMLDPKGSGEYVPIVRTEEVNAITLDSFCKKQGIKTIDYLKVDVEGAESDVLLGAVELLKNQGIKFVQFEISQKMLEGFNRNAKETFNILIENSYECHRIERDGQIGEKVADSSSFYENYIAFPTSLVDAKLLPLNLNRINLIIFPDWIQAEESLAIDLERVILAIAKHPDKSQMTLLIDTRGISEEEAYLILSGVIMNLLMQEDVKVTEEPEISLVGQLEESQWEALLPRLQARILLEYENRQAITTRKADNLPSHKLDGFDNKRIVQSKTGEWTLV